MGWRWGGIYRAGAPVALMAGVGVCQWRARTGRRVFKLRQDASGECKEEQDNDNPSLAVSSARCCPVTSGRTSRSLHRLHGRSPQCRRHQVEEEWRRQSNPAWSRFSVSNTCPTGQRPGNIALALVPVGPDPGRRGQPNPLGRRCSALRRRCVRNMHARTPSTNCQRLVVDTEHSGFLFRGPPAKQAREKRCRCQRQSQVRAKPIHPSSDTRAIGMPPSRRRTLPTRPLKPQSEFWRAIKTSRSRGKYILGQGIECGQD